MKKGMKDTGKASVAGAKMTAKNKSVGAMPKETKAGKPQNFSKKNAGVKAGAMPKKDMANCYGKKGTK
jgi:hypothetical protein